MKFARVSPGSDNSPRFSKISTSQITAQKPLVLCRFSSSQQFFEGFSKINRDRIFFHLALVHIWEPVVLWFWNHTEQLLRLTVIKTVKYPPVQSKHQAPTAVLLHAPTHRRQGFLLSILWCSQNGDHLYKKKDLARYGYKLDMEIKIL